MDRQEHVDWCKHRALEYLDQGDVVQALTSMMSDLSKHPETEGHAGIWLTSLMMLSGHLASVADARRHIEGFR